MSAFDPKVFQLPQNYFFKIQQGLMTTIEVNKFYKKSYKQLYMFLYFCKGNEYKIIIPRRYKFTENDDVLVASDYNIAAYTGHLLSKCADVFSYMVPDVFTKEAFYFHAIIKEDNKRKFAEVLYAIIQAFNPWDRCEINIALEIESAEFFSVLESDELLRISTFGLYILAMKCFCNPEKILHKPIQ